MFYDIFVGLCRLGSDDLRPAPLPLNGHLDVLLMSKKNLCHTVTVKCLCSKVPCVKPKMKLGAWIARTIL